MDRCQRRPAFPGSLAARVHETDEPADSLFALRELGDQRNADVAPTWIDPAGVAGDEAAGKHAHRLTRVQTLRERRVVAGHTGPKIKSGVGLRGRKGAIEDRPQ